MLHGDTKIKLLDGNIKTINEIFNQDKCYVYSLNEDMKVYPAEILSLNKTYHQDVYLTTLDKGKVETSPTHLFLTKDNNFVSANLLRSNESLMPMHFRLNEEQYNHGREMFYDSISNLWLFTHHMVMNYTEPKTDVKGFDIHHINEDYRNNNPNNLTWIDSDKHRIFHERNRQNQYLSERDKNYGNDQKRKVLIISAACLIKKYFLLDKDLIESKKIIGFLRYPLSLFLIDKYFESFDDFIRLSYEYETHLSMQEYMKFTKSPDERKVAKKNAMAKIARLVIDEGKSLNEETYTLKMNALHIKAPPFSKVEKYFRSFNNFLSYVNKFNHKVKSTTIFHYKEKQPLYTMKLKDSKTLCIATTINDFIIIGSE